MLFICTFLPVIFRAIILSCSLLAAILNLGGLAESNNSQVQCNVDLPPPKPLASIDEECVARYGKTNAVIALISNLICFRCFIVCTTPLPNTILRDVFCRFGNLIEAYMLANRNCGYARYTDRHSCEQAIKV